MKTTLLFLTVPLLVPLAALSAAELKLTAPLDYQVVQRASAGAGTLRIAGTVAAASSDATAVEARIHPGKITEWKRLSGTFDGAKFIAEMEEPAGARGSSTVSLERSRITTRKPACASSSAVSAPTGPKPTMATSYSVEVTVPGTPLL